MNAHCTLCGKTPLTKNEIGITKKLLDAHTTKYYCIECLAEYLDVDIDLLLARIEEFINDGCTLF